jgi:hypothetical protein
MFWLYVYYQVRFARKKFNKFFLVLMTVLVFYIFTPRWGVQYIFWHWPFLLLTNVRILRHWIYQAIIPVYLFANYFTITAQKVIFSPWITWILGFLIYLSWLKWGLSFLKKGKVKLE